jgi:molybdopterin-guanine dinucleotide biosynthesis protein A
VVGGLGDRDQICVPVVGRRLQPLAAAYRTSLTAELDELLAADERRVGRLFDRCRVNRLDPDDLLGNAAVAAWDPGLESVVNLNDPQAYAAARARPAPEVAVGWEGRDRGADGRARVVRAATLGGAADALGVGLDGRVTVNGNEADADRELPLEQGDAVAFLRPT